MEEIYKGVKITLREDTNDWECEIDPKSRNRVKDTLPAARKRIDDFLDKEKTFERFDVYYKNDNYYANRLGEIATVTSESGEFFWINFEGKRSLSTKTNFCKNTPENLEIINKIKALKVQIERYKKEVDSLNKSLTL